ncbi:MAG: hypothetical protein M1822_002717 [Bathelium mastoideum]|nr:MAG: hypothetical protein M1822_002717 [Bathelium mastoideum]
MSASPVGVPSGQTPNSTEPPPFRVKKRKNNPLVPMSRSGGRKPSAPPPGRPVANTNGASRLGPNGVPHAPPRPRTTTPQPAIASDTTDKEEDLGPPTVTYPVVTTKRALLEGIRYHAMRLHARGNTVDIYDESQFTRPIRLHRRNPRIQSGEQNAQDGDAEDNDEEPDRKLEEQRKAERQAIREANQAQIAPNVKENPKKRQFGKKVEQVYRSHDNFEANKRSQLRYEETMPWHLEDFDNKNCWIGSYEAPMSESFVVFVPEQAKFRMIPVEKWYKFSQKAKFKVLTAEEAEARMAKGVSEPKFVREAKIRAKQEELLKNNKPSRFLVRKGERGERPGRREADDDDERGEILADENDLDYNMKEDFQDDEENPLFDDEEVEKEAEQKISREQKEANIFKDIKEEKDYDEEEAKEQLEKEELRRKERAMEKALRKAEKRKIEPNGENADIESSGSSDSELDLEKLRKRDNQRFREAREREKAAEASKQTEGKSSKPGSGRGSGANTPKTSNTPSGRPSKHPGPDRIASSSNLKRPGSPGLSETDGNESSRKKHKKKHDKHLAITAPVTAPNSRPMSPDIGTDNEGRKRKVRPAGSGSDTETDGQRKKLKLKLNKSPDTSRAGSPTAPVSAGAVPTSAGGSRAGSPALTPARPLPTAEEIRAIVPASGISMTEVVSKFRANLTDKEKKAAFIRLVTAHVRMQKTPGGTVLFPKNA